jgi:hypothetical protein
MIVPSLTCMLIKTVMTFMAAQVDYSVGPIQRGQPVQADGRAERGSRQEPRHDQTNRCLLWLWEAGDVVESLSRPRFPY